MKAFTTLGRRPERAQVLRALRTAFLLSFALPAAPALLISLVARPALTFGVSEVVIMTVIAVACAGACFVLSRRAYRAEPGLPTALAASIQVAFAPLVPFLLGCASLRAPFTLAVLWGLAAVVFAAAFTRLPGWAGPYPERRPSASGTPTA